MDGERIRKYFSKEMNSLLEQYKEFEILIPNKKTKGADHYGEDGRFVENLIKEVLRKYIPKQLEIFTGFILRPAVKTGINGKTRKGEKDLHSTQIDIIIYDSANYPIFQQFSDCVIVPPEGVIGVISVKKHLRKKDIKDEINALFNISKLCRANTNSGKEIRRPFMALIGISSELSSSNKGEVDWIYNYMCDYYKDKKNMDFDNFINYIGTIQDWSIFKPKPSKNNEVEYLSFSYSDEEFHMSLQFLITCILSVFYDETRSNIHRPGFTSFCPKNARKIGKIPIK